MPQIQDINLEDFYLLSDRLAPGFQERAYVEVNETKHNREEGLRIMKEKLSQTTQFKPKLEDEYLIRFLRARKFNAEQAYKLMCNFYKSRTYDPQQYLPIGKGPKDYTEVYDLNTAVVLNYRNPIDGTCVACCKIGDWTPETGYDPLDIYTPCMYAVDVFLRNPEVQINGVTFILDMRGLQCSWIWRFMTPEYLVNFLRTSHDSVPLRIRAVHIVYQTRLYDMAWFLARSFLPHKLRNRFHLHGSDMGSLHKYVDPRVLPKDFEGEQPELDRQWMCTNIYRYHDEIVKDSYYGYLA